MASGPKDPPSVPLNAWELAADAGGQFLNLPPGSTATVRIPSAGGDE